MLNSSACSNTPLVFLTGWIVSTPKFLGWVSDIVVWDALVLVPSGWGIMTSYSCLFIEQYRFANINRKKAIIIPIASLALMTIVESPYSPKITLTVLSLNCRSASKHSSTALVNFQHPCFCIAGIQTPSRAASVVSVLIQIIKERMLLIFPSHFDEINIPWQWCLIIFSFLTTRDSLLDFNVILIGV